MNMIAMFMSNKYCLNILQRSSDALESLLGLAARQTGVDYDRRFLARQVVAVAITAGVE